MKQVLFATENESKAKRFKKGLLENGIEVITINEIEKRVDVLENGKNAIENAIIKAKAYADVCDYPVFAMDDNLYIDNIPLEKQPGMFVRRVNGRRLNDYEMIDYYSKLAHEYGKDGSIDVLSGILKCKCCGSNMIKRTSKGKVYYYCSNYYRTKKCENNKSILKSIVEEFIKKELNINEITRLNINNNIKYINVVSNNEIEIIKKNGSDN